jgi:hypothetical protein
MYGDFLAHACFKTTAAWTTKVLAIIESNIVV